MRLSGGQMDLFPTAEVRRGVAPVAVSPDVQALAQSLSPNLRLGGSTWSYPGWEGLVYRNSHAPAELARAGLAAYAHHPLFRAVGLDRTFYAPLPVSTYADYAAQVPADFRFVVKAHEFCTLAQFPLHERYGAQRGQPNPYFLDPAYALEQVVGPIREGLGDKAGVVLFQFPPQEVEALGGVDGFINRLYRFLKAMPPGPFYAVEVRNEELLTDRYAKAFELTGALPVLSGWNRLPPLAEQARLTRALERPALAIRWMVRWGMNYDEANLRYEPFNQLVDVDVTTRREVVELASSAIAQNKQVFVTVSNTAEGCAPLTVHALAEGLAARGEAQSDTQE
jgi:uncharacterized protein YecE (DUF72 family)